MAFPLLNWILKRDFIIRKELYDNAVNLIEYLLVSTNFQTYI